MGPLIQHKKTQKWMIAFLKLDCDKGVPQYLVIKQEVA